VNTPERRRRTFDYENGGDEPCFGLFPVHWAAATLYLSLQRRGASTRKTRANPTIFENSADQRVH